MKNSFIEWVMMIIFLMLMILLLIHIGDLGTGTNNLEQFFLNIRELYIKAVSGSFF